MFNGLGHYPFVSIDYQQNHIDTADTGEHVADEALMSGNVDYPNLGTVSEAKGGESQFDRDAALLFLLEAVGFYAA